MIDLTASGLTHTEAKCYQALLERKEWKPVELAKYVQETRTNCYKILDKLVEYNLAERFDKDKKLHYKATNPTRLLQLARDIRIAREQSEKELEVATEQLLRTFTSSNEQPGVQYFQGEEGVEQIFNKVAKSSEEVVFVHSAAGVDFYGFKVMHNLRMLAVNASVKRRALTVDHAGGTIDYKDVDPKVHLTRTWLQNRDYSSPVEWGAFDNKLYIISYGTDALGLLVESQPIADAFKQLFQLLERGQRLLPDYNELPRLAKGRGQTAPHID